MTAGKRVASSGELVKQFPNGILDENEEVRDTKGKVRSPRPIPIERIELVDSFPDGRSFTMQGSFRQERKSRSLWFVYNANDLHQLALPERRGDYSSDTSGDPFGYASLTTHVPRMVPAVFSSDSKFAAVMSGPSLHVLDADNMTEVFKLDTPPDAADLAIEWVRFVGSDVCPSSPSGLSVFDGSSGNLRWRIDDQYGQVTEFQDDSPWHHPPPYCSNDERLAVANWRGIRLVDPKSGRTTKMLALPDGLEVTALSIAAGSSTLIAALSPMEKQDGTGSVLYHGDLARTGYMATNLPASPAGN